MPTYDYVCGSCNHAFERFQSITENALRKCPECGKLKLKRLIGSGSGIIFHGSGFYETDYRSESYKNGARMEKSSAAASTSSSGSSSSCSSSSSSSSTSSSKGKAKKKVKKAS